MLRFYELAITRPLSRIVVGVSIPIGMNLHFRSQGPASWLLDDRRSKLHPRLGSLTRLRVPFRWLCAEGNQF